MQLPRVLEIAKTAIDAGYMIALVEGESDKLALITLAERFLRPLDAENIAVVAMGGVTNIGHFLKLFEPQMQSTKLAGLCDIGEENIIRHAFENAGFGPILTKADMEKLGFFVCDIDLEDELIRSLGSDKVIEVAKTQGEFTSFQTFQKQAAWRNRSTESQLRRWIAGKARRKARYAKLLVEAMDLDCVPEPLDRLLTHILSADSDRSAA